MAQLEKDITAERVKAGLRRAKDKENEKCTAAELEVSKNTVARHL